MRSARADPQRVPSRQRVCAVVLTLDEEVNIERCATSLKWCDDLVVVDSGSTDKTCSLAEGLGARVFERKQPIYLIDDQRNWALRECAIDAEWVLFVDADEVIPAVLVDEIRRRCVVEAPVDGYQLSPKYLFWGVWMKRSMNYPNWHDRLVRRGAVTFEGGVWEGFAPGTRVAQIPEPYLHYGNSKGFADWLERHDRYSTWEADSLADYLDSGDPRAFRTHRKIGRRRLAARAWPVRPLARFAVMYLLRGGFLDGPPALVFCARYALYEYMTVEKMLERRRTHAGLPL